MLEASDVEADNRISDFILYERTVLGLATEAAIGRWGEGVSMVQVRVVKTPVVPFEQRMTDTVTEATSFTDGWRLPLRVEGIDTTVFTRMFAEDRDR